MDQDNSKLLRALKSNDYKNNDQYDAPPQSRNNYNQNNYGYNQPPQNYQNNHNNYEIISES